MTVALLPVMILRTTGRGQLVESGVVCGVGIDGTTVLHMLAETARAEDRSRSTVYLANRLSASKG